MEAKVRELDCEVEEVWNSTLLHEEDLQPTKTFPQNYTAFVNLFEHVEVRQQTTTINKLPLLKPSSEIEEQAMQYLPSLDDFGFSSY